MALLAEEKPAPHEASSLTLLGADGDVVFARGRNAHTPRCASEPRAVANAPAPIQLRPNIVSDLFEPLFSLPTRMPPTAWAGHIPFMFVLFKLLRPECYVELGVHNGASLIAASTAARQYHLPTQIYGIDSWEGDAHAGYYNGDKVFEELQSYLARTFKNVTLIRNYFHTARPLFAAGSIDFLHIDGFHTYDAVKADYTSWITAMAPNGVIMLHDTAVYGSGFGVHRLWRELSHHYRTVEFLHSHGLGVLFLDENDPRIEPLLAISRDPESWNFYRDMAALVAHTLPDRMGWLESAKQNAELKKENKKLKKKADQIHASTSWKVTKPLRLIRSLLG
jgi:hypothetical protein